MFKIKNYYKRRVGEMALSTDYYINADGIIEIEAFLRLTLNSASTVSPIAGKLLMQVCQNMINNLYYTYNHRVDTLTRFRINDEILK